MLCFFFGGGLDGSIVPSADKRVSPNNSHTGSLALWVLLCATVGFGFVVLCVYNTSFVVYLHGGALPFALWPVLHGYSRSRCINEAQVCSFECVLLEVRSKPLPLLGSAS
jgi:hypothetical protein